MAETGVDSFVGNDLSQFKAEILMKSPLHEFSPAEWAIYNNQLDILKKFLLATREYSYEGLCFFGTNLLALAIQYHNFEAIKIICKSTLFNLYGKGFLSIAVQHHAPEEILNYLLDYCGLAIEIDNKSVGGMYRRPIEACVKFNNMKAAVLLLKRGADIGSQDSINPNEFALATILTENKDRFLRYILAGMPSMCSFKDRSSNSLLHHAVVFAQDPKMIMAITDSCPNSSFDADNRFGFSPLTFLIHCHQDERSEMALALIQVGADLYRQSSNRLRPLEMIVHHVFEKTFKLILEESRGWASDVRNIFISKLTEIICSFKNWQFLEQVIAIYPNIPTTRIDTDDITFSVFLAENCNLTFRLLLSQKSIKIPVGALKMIQQSNSTEFMAIAREFGVSDDVELSVYNSNSIWTITDNEIVEMRESRPSIETTRF